MGLAERKSKQRVGNDPRNLAWSENAARFGHKYLANLGWTPAMGLGASGEGRTTHIAVAHKLDQLGIGANPAQGPDAIAWKQNKEFEGLLDRLNKERTSGAASPDVASSVLEEDGSTSESSSANKKPVERKKKRKTMDKDGKDATAAASSPNSSTDDDDGERPAAEVRPTAVKGLPRRMAHRARFQASKRMVASSSAALSEILGISASSSARATPTPTPPSTSTITPIYDTPPADGKSLIHTSSVSMADYFKQKMVGKSLAVARPPLENGRDEDEDEGRPRLGLGSARRDDVGAGPSTSESRSKADGGNPQKVASIDAASSMEAALPSSHKSSKKSKKKFKIVPDQVEASPVADAEENDPPRKKRRKERDSKKSKRRKEKADQSSE